MKMKKTDTKVTKYKHGSFNIFVVEAEFGNEYWHGTGFEAYLSHDDYSEMEYMFGELREQQNHTQTDEEMIETIDANLVEYEMNYLKDRLEEEKCWESEVE